MATDDKTVVSVTSESDVTPQQADLMASVETSVKPPPLSEQAALVKSLKDVYGAAIGLVVEDSGDLLGLTIASIGEQISVGAYGAAYKSLQGLMNQADAYARDAVEVNQELMKITGLSATAAESSAYGVDNLAKKTQENMMNSLRLAGQTAIELENGQKTYMRFISSPTEMLKTYSEAILRDTRLYRAAAEGVSDELLISTELATKRLGFSADTLNEIMQREFSKTGEISGKLLDKIEKDLLATVAITGDNIEKLSKDLQQALGDFQHFGMMTEEQILSLSSNIGKLGMNMNDVAKISEKFQTFEGASRVASDIAAATGVALDTHKLFELSLTDPMQMMTELITQMQSGGISYDQLSFPMKNYLAKVLTVDPTMLERMLKANVDEIEDIAAEITGKAEEITDDQKKAQLAGMQPIEVPDFADAKDQMTQLENLSVGTAKNIEKAYAAGGQAISDMLAITTEDYNAVSERIQNQRELMEKLSDQILTKSKEARDAAKTEAPPSATPVPTGETASAERIPPPETTIPASNQAAAAAAASPVPTAVAPSPEIPPNPAAPPAQQLGTVPAPLPVTGASPVSAPQLPTDSPAAVPAAPVVPPAAPAPAGTSSSGAAPPESEAGKATTKNFTNEQEEQVFTVYLRPAPGFESIIEGSTLRVIESGYIDARGVKRRVEVVDM